MVSIFSLCLTVAYVMRAVMGYLQPPFPPFFVGLHAMSVHLLSYNILSLKSSSQVEEHHPQEESQTAHPANPQEGLFARFERFLLVDNLLYHHTVFSRNIGRIVQEYVVIDGVSVRPESVYGLLHIFLYRITFHEHVNTVVMVGAVALHNHTIETVGFALIVADAVFREHACRCLPRG